MLFPVTQVRTLYPTGHTTLLRRRINVNDVSGASLRNFSSSFANFCQLNVIVIVIVNVFVSVLISVGIDVGVFVSRNYTWI